MAKRESIGQRLHRLRIERGLSQRDLSSPGISYAYISRIEAGARKVRSEARGVAHRPMPDATQMPLDADDG
jgi:transcriptional regulator with XRE-family HTH domain